MNKKSALVSGKPLKVLFFFSIPMILSVTLQQFYNICDSFIAGKYVSEYALAAISATYPVTMLYLALATGFGVGVNIVCAKFIGAKENSKAKQTISTAIITISIIGLIVSIFAALLAGPIMKAINVDQLYFKDAEIYLRYYSIGIICLCLYNTITNIFQSIGNSRIPLYLLIASTIINIILDLIFVINLNMGVEGLALATLLSLIFVTIISAIVLFFYQRKMLNNDDTNNKIKLYDKQILKQILVISIPSIIQASIISLGQVFIQALVNTCDPSVVAGYGAAYKVVYIVVNIYTTMSNAISTYTSQNAGAKEFDRIKQGFKSGLLIVGIITIIAMLIFLTIPQYLLLLFTKDGSSKDIIESGKLFIYVVVPFYIFMWLKIPCDGVLKGSKDMRNFMIATFADLIVRVSLSYILYYSLDKNEIGIYISWPIGWAVGMILSLTFYKLGRWKKLIGYN